MARHRLNAQASPLLTADSASQNGRHRAARTGALPATATAGAFVALVGAIGLTVGGAAQAAAQPASTPIDEAISTLAAHPAAASLAAHPAVSSLAAHPAVASLPSDLALPAPFDDVVRGLLPANPTQPGVRATASPTTGTVTSGYGPRWGTTHYGLDIANDIGTPVYAVTDGTVLESGPADGFGQWVRVQQDDGTIGVFGHVDESYVTAGQQVRAGEQIATVGNEGQSTGPHLHYEVWDTNGAKIDPQVWLNNRGVSIN